jgi:hypothetical protein
VCFHVVVQDALLAEKLATHRALVRTFPCMNGHVICETAGGRETIAADVTGVIFLAEVGLHMAAQRLGQWERFTTDFTRVLLFSRVRFFVDFQTAQDSVGSVTLTTLKRLVPSVGAKVDLQHTELRERFVAYVALVSFLSTVHSYVAGQRTRIFAHFAALFTPENFRGHVLALMPLQVPVPTKLFVTSVTLEGELFSVRHHVLLQVAVPREPLATDGTSKGQVTRMVAHVALQTRRHRKRLRALAALEGPLSGVTSCVDLQRRFVPEVFSTLAALVAGFTGFFLLGTAK